VWLQQVCGIPFASWRYGLNGTFVEAALNVRLGVRRREYLAEKGWLLFKSGGNSVPYYRLIGRRGEERRSISWICFLTGYFKQEELRLQPSAL